ncbi:hypothetical protein Q3A66_20435 [Hymenobacter sp. BT770]|uniref:hypothetical protein n=1 Tax=Hymenobacter sp. BT770 TaxID=2886942 RepID=UPI001D122C57|nr:hypothetical protein [Hymenobacter sp. BT770]MCC3155381.1 hypothetical protein [Hymenobacter sp. BT770]MDO3417442.1 hypothetical protein [Hymenobacter sp. BT770]
MATTDPIPPATAVPLESRPRFLAASRTAAPAARRVGRSEEIRPERATPPRPAPAVAPRMRSALLLALVVSLGTLLAACKKDSTDPVVPEEPTTIVVVTPSDMKGWAKQVTGTAPATVELVTGPATPVLGKGSARFATAANHNHTFSFSRLRNTQYAGTLLSDITKLTFSTYVERRDSSVDIPFLVLHVDTNGDGQPDDIVNFTPYYQTGKFLVPGVLDQWVSKTNSWQTWDALHGGWFILDNTSDAASILSDPDHNGKLITLASYIALHPTATIQNLPNGPGGIRMGVGGPIFGNHFIGYIDQYTIGIKGKNTTYDFEN